MSATFRAVARRGRRWLPVIGLADLGGTLGALTLPLVLGAAIDAMVTGGDARPWVLAAVGLAVLGVTCDLLDVWAGTMTVADAAAWLRERLVRHVLAVGPRGAARFDVGDLVSRVSGNAVDAAQAGPTLVTVVTAALPSLGSLVLLGLLHPWLAVAFVAGVALVALVLRAFAVHTTRAMAAYQRAQGRIAARLAESLAGARTIAAAGTVERERERVLEPLPTLHEQGRRTWLLLSRSGSQAAVVGPAVLVAVLATGGLLVTAGRISPGELFAAGQYAALGAGLGGLTGVFGRLARARAGGGRADEVLAVEPVRHGTRELPADGDGTLELRGVRVVEDGVRLLDDVTLVVPGGTVAAVVGPSGAGK
ncbi:MAG TPA: ABC transporter ATP-binding protein, partial [Pseudonocardiaceae bacterium]